MPKHKTHKALARRVKVSKNGKLMRRSSFARHLRRKKSKGSIRNLKQSITITGPLERKIRHILGV